MWTGIFPFGRYMRFVQNGVQSVLIPFAFTNSPFLTGHYVFAGCCPRQKLQRSINTPNLMNTNEWPLLKMSFPLKMTWWPDWKLIIIGALSPFECIPPKTFSVSTLPTFPWPLPSQPFPSSSLPFWCYLFMIILLQTGTGLYSVAVSPINTKCSKLRPFAIW